MYVILKLLTQLFLGNSELAKEKILSIFQHCANIHTFAAFSQFQACQHDPITELRPWIEPGEGTCHRYCLGLALSDLYLSICQSDNFWLDIWKDILYKGSFEMEKLKEAVLGQHLQNLKDLEHMTGMSCTIIMIVIFTLYFRVHSYL